MGDSHRSLAKAGILASVGLVLSVVGYAHAAAALDAQGADALLEHGNLGLAALVVLGILAPIGVTVAAACFLIRRVVAMFASQLTAQQAEREGMADAHRLERQEAMRAENAERKIEREERQRMCQRHLEHDEATLQALHALVERANGGK